MTDFNVAALEEQLQATGQLFARVHYHPAPVLVGPRQKVAEAIDALGAHGITEARVITSEYLDEVQILPETMFRRADYEFWPVKP